MEALKITIGLYRRDADDCERRGHLQAATVIRREARRMEAVLAYLVEGLSWELMVERGDGEG